MTMLALGEWVEFSPALKAAVVLGGVIALLLAVKVGQVMIRLLFGLIGLGLLAGAVWWFVMKH
jgi:uncharacterized membrane protein YebE (DUF533 family)